MMIENKIKSLHLFCRVAFFSLVVVVVVVVAVVVVCTGIDTVSNNLPIFIG